MSNADGSAPRGAQARLRLVSRGLGPPALAARGLTAVGASILFILGVVCVAVW